VYQIRGDIRRQNEAYSTSLDLTAVICPCCYFHPSLVRFWCWAITGRSTTYPVVRSQCIIGNFKSLSVHEMLGLGAEVEVWLGRRWRRFEWLASRSEGVAVRRALGVSWRPIFSMTMSESTSLSPRPVAALVISRLSDNVFIPHSSIRVQSHRLWLNVDMGSCAFTFSFGEPLPVRPIGPRLTTTNCNRNVEPSGHMECDGTKLAKGTISHSIRRRRCLSKTEVFPGSLIRLFFHYH